MQASIDGFKRRKVSEGDAIGYMKLAVSLAQGARDACVERHSNLDSGKSDADSPSSRRRLLIAGSVGSYGASLHNGAEYTGDYGDVTEEDLVEFHRYLTNIIRCMSCFYYALFCTSRGMFLTTQLSALYTAKQICLLRTNVS